jgi:transglutaminase-like putative cysteine protease/pimeloyl-ACP methyl ester carboxylesterase
MGSQVLEQETITWNTPRMFRLTPLFLVLSGALAMTPQPARAETPARPSAHWWPAAVERALVDADTNRAEIVQALNDVPEAQREALQFLVEQMPARDLRSLTAAYLKENVSLAWDAFQRAPWRDRVPKEIFFNDVLPYASLNESRDPWRRKLYDLAAPLVADCQTPSDAAQRLNQKLFKLTNVRYSTQRHRADQGPLETIDTGLATCTGLSILLVDACRAVGVPARVTATPLWFNKRGNHTWVEIWDGDWHFTGAAEPDPKGLDRGWFKHDAEQALKDVPQHAIYASSFAKTGLSFPLVWARDVQYVSAVNVTEHYTPKTTPPAETNQIRLLVKVLDRPAGQRVATKVIVTEAGNDAAQLEGTSRGETADLNDVLPFTLARDRTYEVRVEAAERTVQREFHPGSNAQEVLLLTLNDTPAITLPSQRCYASPPITHALKPKEEAQLKKSFTEFFLAPTNKQATWKFPGSLEKLLRGNEAAVRRAAWEAYRAAPLHQAQHDDFEMNQVRFEKYLSPYTVKEVGTRPTNGWPLFIAMHGGGGAPKQVNDSQWKHMQVYYRDHPEAGGYLYLALRAPNDTWNGFYDTYVYPLVANLIRQFLLFGDVDPNKVFLMGYSHGGYGAFAIGPKMPDRFAAVHASAAAPTDGETTAKTLRNTIFTVMVGEKDTLYGRYERDQKFKTTIETLRGERSDIYPVAVQIIAGNGHTGLPDRDKIVDMYPAVRNPVPSELTWLMTDKVITDFFWLRCPAPGKQREIDALCRDNRLTVTTTTNVTMASVMLDRRLVDFDRPVAMELNGKALKPAKLQPSLRVLGQTLLRSGDPELAFTAQIDLPREASNGKK